MPPLDPFVVLALLVVAVCLLLLRVFGVSTDDGEDE